MAVPGIEPSEARLLQGRLFQGRLFSYADTQRYRVGANYLSLPINRPVAEVRSNNQDGAMSTDPRNSDVNYEPSVTGGRSHKSEGFEYSRAPLAGTVRQSRIAKTLDFRQAGDLYRSFDEPMRADLVANFAGDLDKVSNPQVKVRIVSFLYQADAEYGSRVAEAVDVSVDDVKRMIAANDGLEPTARKTVELTSGGKRQASAGATQESR